jgi:lysophospholipase L1-like esterase
MPQLNLLFPRALIMQYTPLENSFHGRSWWQLFLLLVLTPALVASSGSFGWALQASGPDRWEEAIARFEEEDRHHSPPEDAVLFVGSSSIRLWHTADHFPQYVTLNRGFGGSKITDVLHFLERIVVKYRPRVIVFYAGDNDVAAGRTAQQIVGDFETFLAAVGKQLPETHVIYVPVKPSLARWELWPVMRQANERIQSLLAESDAWHYADTATPMLGADATPRPELFARDGLHLSDEGYRLWTQVVRQVLNQLAQQGLLVSQDGAENDAQQTAEWAQALRLYSSFDTGADADYARGDRRAYTASDPSRKETREGLHVPGAEIVEGGRWGKALRFGPKTEEVLLYKGSENLPYAEDGFSGTISLWMSLDPEEDLEPGFVDPLQITDKTWNNACLFLDFSKDEQPRHFRLGVFSDYTVWNPQDRNWDDIPEDERPMITVRRHPFAHGKWTHVAFTYSGFNSSADAEATLYMDGTPVGSLTGTQKFTWNPNDVAIMLGIYYTGLIDELAIFDRAFSAEEIEQLAGRSQALNAILKSQAE